MDPRGHSRRFPVPFLAGQYLYVQNKAHVLRGLHEAPYKKYLCVLEGEIYDVVVDPLTCEIESLLLSAGQSRLIPANKIHGYYSADKSQLFYAIEAPYADERTHSYLKFGINWPFRDLPILSEKDSIAMTK